MNFRLSVESVIYREDKGQKHVLLVKRSSDCKVAPNEWNVPAGKVKLLETTMQAVVRESMEETRLSVEVVRLLSETVLEMMSSGETVYRNIFTYMVVPADPDQQIVLNREHTEFAWAGEEEIGNDKYPSLMPHLKKSILAGFDLLNGK